MKKINLNDFQEFMLSNNSTVKGGACTGGGFYNFGNGNYCTWESDETQAGGNTIYYDIRCQFYE